MTTDFWAEHLEWCLRDRPGLTEHPVIAQLLGLYVARLKAYCAMPLLIRTFEPVGLALQSELEELQGWVLKGGPRAWTENDDNKVGNLFVNFGLSYEGAKNAARQVRKLNAKIRPHDKRTIAIRAKELKDADPSLSWADVTGQVCDCPRHPNHTESCTSQLKVAVTELNEVLRKYQEDNP